LCFEHVDNLGAYSIPSETGLLTQLRFCEFSKEEFFNSLATVI
jgi:hypothetical protein